MNAPHPFALSLPALLGAIGLSCATPAICATDPLAFDASRFTTLTITLDGQPMQVRRYEAVYAGKPVEADISRPPTLGPPPGAAAGPPAAAPLPAPANPNGLAPLDGAAPVRPPPADPRAYQTLYIYVPTASLGSDSAPIILQVGNAGWVASPAQDIIREGAAFSGSSNTDNTGAALKAGHVVVSAGTRGRNLRGVNGDYIGKAPAVIVDAKAAIRYLRLNDAAMPGSAERIVITGVSGGGGLSVAIAASGNSPDYLPYLAQIGAAGVDARGASTIRDDVFATIAYCPINDLGNADLAYEWQYGALRTAENTAPGRFTPASAAASALLAAQYPAFLAALDLRREDGSPLNAQTLPQSILARVRASVEGALARGERVPALGDAFEIAQRGRPGQPAPAPLKLRNDWLTVEDGQVRSIDYAAYLRFVAATQPLKGTPAFDSTASTGNVGVSGENTLFGPATVPYSNFTAYGWNSNEAAGDGSGRDDTGLDWRAFTAGPGQELARQVRLTSPLPYLTGSESSPAPYWYVRHGLIDRDTAFAVQETLYHAARSHSAIRAVDYKLAWMQGHAGNYDVQEAYGWLARVLAEAGPPTR